MNFILLFTSYIIYKLYNNNINKISNNNDVFLYKVENNNNICGNKNNHFINNNYIS